MSILNPEESGGTAGNRLEKNERMEENGGAPKLNGGQRPLGFGTR